VLPYFRAILIARKWETCTDPVRVDTRSGPRGVRILIFEHKQCACARCVGESKGGALFLFERSERQKPRVGVAQDFCQEIYE
ncbi:MAG: hypothetical protein UY03_C0001G0060, partial [Parcubacteria group bacterium GW2011_GWA2_47_64]